MGQARSNPEGSGMNINTSLKTVQHAVAITRVFSAAIMLLLLFKLVTYVLQADTFGVELLMVGLGLLAALVELVRAFLTNTRAF
jgi:hypothetical protein